MGISDTTRWGWRWAAWSSELRIWGKRSETPSVGRRPRSRCLLCPAGVRCFRGSCCLKSCGNCSTYRVGTSSSPFCTGCVVGFLPSWYLHLPFGPLTMVPLPRGGSREPLTCVTKSRHLTPLCWLLIRAVATKLHMC